MTTGDLAPSGPVMRALDPRTPVLVGAGTASGFFDVSKDNFTFAGGTPSSFLNPAVTNIGAGFASPTVTLAPGAKKTFSISNRSRRTRSTPR